MPTLRDFVRAMRPSNWYKATIVLAGPVFSGRIFELNWLVLMFAFLSFSFVASANYVLNDLKDRENDLHHPKKKNRPIASGKISGKQASWFFIFLLIVGLVFGWMANFIVLQLVGIYFIVNLAYTHYLKRLSIIDAFTIAVGYLLRALAGCYAVGIVVTNWFYLAIFSLAVYLAFCKRLAEIKVSGVKHKASLEEYEDIIEIAIGISGSISLTLFAIYVANVGGHMVWSFPLAMMGLLIHLRESVKGYEVHESLRKPELILTLIAFMAVILVGLYA
ncbi:MAG: UbiA prenyltransferase family protein [Candidatus Altiarchaeota archaeon]|nr:UbiA prenyltransferase family protein [Candidatus Altiarchaeota archaeon]